MGFDSSPCAAIAVRSCPTTLRMIAVHLVLDIERTQRCLSYFQTSIVHKSIRNSKRDACPWAGRILADKCGTFDTTKCAGEHAHWSRLGQSTAMQTSTRSAQAQHSQNNDGSVGDWHSLDRHEDIRVNLADHAKNTTCPLRAGPKISGCTRLPPDVLFTGLSYAKPRRPRRYTPESTTERQRANCQSSQ